MRLHRDVGRRPARALSEPLDPDKVLNLRRDPEEARARLWHLASLGFDDVHLTARNAA